MFLGNCLLTYIVLSPFFNSMTEKTWLPCFIGALCCFFSLLSAVGYAIFDKTQKSKNYAIGEENFEEYIPRWKDIKTISIIYWVVNLYHMVFYLSFHGVATNLSNQIHEFATSAMNSFNVFGMFTLGEIQDSTINTNGGYYYSQLFLAGVSLVSIFISVIILVLDKKRAGILEAPLPEDEIEPIEDSQWLLNQEENHKI